MGVLYALESIRTPALDKIMSVITLLGGELFFMVIAVTVFWCVSKREGYYLMIVGFFGTVINQFLKILCCVPRPWIKDPDFTIVESARAEATGYSFPSGHSQMMATVGSAIPLWYRKNSLWYFFIPLMFLVAFSRMYLGVHYPRDVFVGLLLGVGISWLCAKLWDRALGHSGLFAATFGLMSIFLFVARSHDFLQLYGLFGGFAAGCAYEERYVRFGMRDRASRKAARFVLGLCVIGMVYGLGKLLPDLLWLIPIRYFFVAFAGYGLVPMLFKKLGI